MAVTPSNNTERSIRFIVVVDNGFVSVVALLATGGDLSAYSTGTSLKLRDVPTTKL
jgi:hypothetical protein